MHEWWQWLLMDMVMYFTGHAASFMVMWCNRIRGECFIPWPLDCACNVRSMVVGGWLCKTIGPCPLLLLLQTLLRS